MILDKKFSGILDQGIGVLIVFDEVSVDMANNTALEMIQQCSVSRPKRFIRFAADSPGTAWIEI